MWQACVSCCWWRASHSLWGKASEPAAKQSSKKHRCHQPPPPNVNTFWLEALSVVQAPCWTLEWNTSLIKTALTNSSVCHLPRSVAPTRICFYLSYFLPGNKQSNRLTAQPVPLWEGHDTPLSWQPLSLLINHWDCSQWQSLQNVWQVALGSIKVLCWNSDTFVCTRFNSFCEGEGYTAMGHSTRKTNSPGSKHPASPDC